LYVLYFYSSYFYPMADVHDKATRSYNMSQIRSKNTKPEILVRKFLHAQGFRYKLHEKSFLANWILVCQNSKLSFLFFVTYINAMKIVRILSFQLKGYNLLHIIL